MSIYELKSEDAKKHATRGSVMMLAVTTEAELSKLRAWISARFEKVDADFAKVDAQFDEDE